MVKVFISIVCSILLSNNSVLSSLNNRNLILNPSQASQIVQSEVYQDVTIGTSPNESPINGFVQDIALSSQNSSYSSANMINYNLKSGKTNFEQFNPDSYQMRNSFTDNTQNQKSSYSMLTLKKDHSILASKECLPGDSGYSAIPTSILGTDERVQITNPSAWPFRGTCRLYTEYDNVYNNATKEYKTRAFIGTGFMEGPNLLVTAGHCVYSDVTDNGDYKDDIKNPRFPNRIMVYAGANGYSDLNSSYVYYATVDEINIQKQYYEKPRSDYDWAACKLNWNLGISTGYYGKICNWYERNASVYSYGYLGDKPATMRETHGKLVRQTNYRYEYDFDTVGGQSGSPVFMQAEDGSAYVCGIHTSGSSTYNSGTKINSFIFHYLLSFITNHNYEHSVGTISPNEYGFDDAYPTDVETKTQYKNHYTDKNFHFQTIRYRTGYIHNEYIVMSCMRRNVIEAFIEYKFDTPISKFTVQLSHWREKEIEWLHKDTGIAELQYRHDNKRNQKLDLLSDETALPRDRANPNSYSIVFDEAVTRIRFYEKANLQYFNDNNRGRICIGKITFYSKEGSI